MLTALEQQVLQDFRAHPGRDLPMPGISSREDWLRLGLGLLLAAGRKVRALRFSPLADAVVFKADGSPSVPVEIEIETSLREQLQRIAPATCVMGEETGGCISGSGCSVAIDPVDGTWALVNRSETHATSLAFFEQGRVFLGMVANAATGEIAYALEGGPARLLQLACFAEPDAAYDLPLVGRPAQPLLVNLHPARTAGRFVDGFVEAWGRREIAMLKSPGGSPAWALLEAAKGSFVYVNRWSAQACAPYDLAGSILLLRCAGGEAVGLDGQAIDAYRHRGLFIAGIDADAVAAVVAICRRIDQDAQPQRPG